jgi:hypothetical protein
MVITKSQKNVLEISLFQMNQKTSVKTIFHEIKAESKENFNKFIQSSFIKHDTLTLETDIHPMISLKIQNESIKNKAKLTLFITQIIHQTFFIFLLSHSYEQIESFLYQSCFKSSSC